MYCFVFQMFDMLMVWLLGCFRHPDGCGYYLEVTGSVVVRGFFLLYVAQPLCGIFVFCHLFVM